MGVPQDSVLGPVLFLLCINDICNAIPDAKIKLFADDSNLFLYDTSLSNLYHRANLCLTYLSKWFLVNRLSLSVDKMCYSIFGNQHNDSFTPNLQVEINGKAIQKIECCKYLGICINNNLSWREHIDYVHKKLIKFTSIFYKIRNKLNCDILKLLYFAFVYPHLLYGIEIYGNTCYSFINKLEKLNNKILRILQNKSLSTHSIELYKHYNTLPITDLHLYQILLFVHKFIHHRQNLPDIFATYFTRSLSKGISTQAKMHIIIYIYRRIDLYLNINKAVKPCSRLITACE